VEEKTLTTSAIFITLPKGRKIAQSGHPECEVEEMGVENIGSEVHVGSWSVARRRRDRRKRIRRLRLFQDSKKTCFDQFGSYVFTFYAENKRIQ
jgi:hypothetical protein